MKLWSIFLICLCISYCQTETKVINSQNKNKKPSDQKISDIHVLSYNTCWECMSNNHNLTKTKGSASQLGKACKAVTKGSEITLCAQNISDLLEGIAHSSKKDTHFDFISFQEAVRWKALQKISPQSLNKLKHISYKKGVAEVVTFYNPQKYSLEQHIGYTFQAGRPYQILIFREGLIYINLHLGHNKTPLNVTTALSQTLKKLVPIAQEIAYLKHFRIIMAGDFNDHKNPPLFSVFSPLNLAGIATQVKLKKHIISCCDTKTSSKKWQGSLYGDYIFDSLDIKEFEVPHNYDLTKLYSDHLPVLATLQGLNTKNPSEAIDLSKTKSVGIYLVPTISTRIKLWKIISKNSYFKKWGGPHITLGGFISIKADRLNKMMTDLKKVDTSNWKIKNINNIKIKQKSNLELAHFLSPLLDEGKKILEKNEWENIKNDWHLTLGYQTDHTSKTKSDMLNLIKDAHWEWVIALKNEENKVSWVPSWSQFK